MDKYMSRAPLLNYDNLCILFSDYQKLIFGHNMYLNYWIKYNIREINLEHIDMIEYNQLYKLYTIIYKNIKCYLKVSQCTLENIREIYIFNLLNGTIAPKLIHYGYIETPHGMMILMILEYIQFKERVKTSDITREKIMEVSELCDDFGLNLRKCKIACDVKGNVWLIDLQNTILVNNIIFS